MAAKRAARSDGVRVFRQIVKLGVGSVKAALSCPAHPRVTLPVGQRLSKRMKNKGNE